MYFIVSNAVRLIALCIIILLCSLNNVRNAIFFFQRIPKVTVSRDEGLVELEISDDPYDVQRVEVQSAPCIVTVCKVLLILIITL